MTTANLYASIPSITWVVRVGSTAIRSSVATDPIFLSKNVNLGHLQPSSSERRAYPRNCHFRVPGHILR